jgi:hypothetical protein
VWHMQTRSWLLFSFTAHHASRHVQVRVMRGALKGQVFTTQEPPPDENTMPVSTEYSQGVLAVYEACRRGVKTGVVRRGHLVDARIDGGLLLELYSRDGVGTMISTDFYEGIRHAGPADVSAIKVRANSACVAVYAAVAECRVRGLDLGCGLPRSTP